MLFKTFQMFKRFPSTSLRSAQDRRFVQTVQLGGSILRNDLLELAASYRLEAAIRRISK
jgi:hypothetical protein